MQPGEKLAEFQLGWPEAAGANEACRTVDMPLTFRFHINACLSHVLLLIMMQVLACNYGTAQARLPSAT